MSLQWYTECTYVCTIQYVYVNQNIKLLKKMHLRFYKAVKHLDVNSLKKLSNQEIHKEVPRVSP